MNHPDLIAKAIAEASVAKLLVIASHIEREAKSQAGILGLSQLARLFLREPMRGAELVSAMKDEVALALSDLVTDLRLEHNRRELLNGKKPEQPRLYNDVGDAVGCGASSTPVTQSDRTGA